MRYTPSGHQAGQGIYHAVRLDVPTCPDGQTLPGALGRAECGPNPLRDPRFGVTWRVDDDPSVGPVSMSRESGFQQITTPANSGVDCDTMRLVLSQEAQT